MTRLLILAAILLAGLTTAATSAARTCSDPFECDRAPKPHARYPLSVERAKAETRRRAGIEASGWAYPGYIQTSIASRCTRKAPRAIDCKFGVYDVGGAPQGQRKSCHFVAHIIQPKNERRLRSAVENLGCEFH